MHKRVYILFFASILLAAAMAVYTVSAVRAAVEVDPFLERNDQVKSLVDEIDEKKKKIESLKNAASEYQKKIEESRTQSASLKNQLGIIENLLTKAQLDIQTAQVQIDTNKLEIDALEYEIGKREEEIRINKERLIEYIRLIYKNDQQTTLELLILNDSFSEFFTQLNFAEELQADLRKSVDQLQLMKAALETRRAELAVKQEELEKSKKELENNRLRYEEDQEAKAVLLSRTNSNEQRYQSLLIETKQVQNEIDSDILNIEGELKLKIERLRTGGTTAKTTLVSWPVEHSRGISAYFHDPGYPFRHVFEHPAIDIRAYQSTPISAPADGYVARTADNGYGYSYVILIHDNGVSTVYGHVSKILVREDQFVKAGDVIALSGGKPGTRGAGNLTTGPHLHFEVRLNGIPVNPLDYLP